MVSSAFRVKKDRVSVLVNGVRALNVLTAVVQLLSGVGSLMSFLYLDIASSLVAVYVILFALLLLLFECRFRMTDAFLREYFGFLYTYKGLGGFLLIVGILDLGMAGGAFGPIAGAAACVNAMIVFVVGCCAPRYNSSAETITTANVPMKSYGSATAKSAAAHMAIPIAPPYETKSKKNSKNNRKGSALLNTTL
uniref:Golgi apparatus membrane protein TVP15 n=1 Tax=Globisporangium ultimum (strain ATCC 200006 / CBS 805.95 / DAOM BR144) TaxID=431595 RepID=K3W9W0_GLOUD